MSSESVASSRNDLSSLSLALGIGAWAWPAILLFMLRLTLTSMSGTVPLAPAAGIELLIGLAAVATGAASLSRINQPGDPGKREARGGIALGLIALGSLLVLVLVIGVLSQPWFMI